MTEQQVQEQMGSQVSLIVSGETGPQTEPSEIRDLQTGQVIRAG